MIRIGCIGGGQLLMLMALDSRRKALPFEFIALDPSKECPARPYLAEFIQGDFKDQWKIRELASKADILTYELEFTNSDALQLLTLKLPIHPSPSTLKTIQNKYTQAKFLRDHKIDVPDFEFVDDANSIKTALNLFGYPLMLKACYDSYDGIGNFLVKEDDEIEEALRYFGGKKLMAQEFIPFDKEISVIASKNTQGEIRLFPVAENIHLNNILRTTIVSNRLDDKTKAKAQDLAYRVMDAFQGAGTFGIEMFARDGEVSINEIAPRVHNSGHYTLDACETSQFEQHLRAISGMSLGSTEMNCDIAIMHNILGGMNGYTGRFKFEGLEELSTMPGVSFYDYGKREISSKRLRKLGHATFKYNNVISLDNALKDSLSAMQRIKIKEAA